MEIQITMAVLASVSLVLAALLAGQPMTSSAFANYDDEDDKDDKDDKDCERGSDEPRCKVCSKKHPGQGDPPKCD